MAGCGSCGPTDGSGTGTRVMEFYVVETASGREIPAEEGGGIWPSWHEARVAAEKLGTGYKADDRTVLV